jgi:hypothetical protein
MMRLGIWPGRRLGGQNRAEDWGEMTDPSPASSWRSVHPCGRPRASVALTIKPIADRTAYQRTLMRRRRHAERIKRENEMRANFGPGNI